MRTRAWPFTLALTLAWPGVAAAQRPQVTRLTVGDGLPSATVTALAQDRSGRLFLVNRGRVVVYDGRSFETYSQGKDAPSVPVAALAADPSGHVWAASQGAPEVFCWREWKWEKLPPLPAPAERAWFTTALAVTAQGEPVIGTRTDGLFVSERGGWSQLGADTGLPVNEVTALARHGDGVAIGTPVRLCRLAAGQVDCAWRANDPRLAEPILALADVSGKDGPRVAVLTPSRVLVLGRDGWSVRAEGLTLDLGRTPVKAAVGWIGADASTSERRARCSSSARTTPGPGRSASSMASPARERWRSCPIAKALSGSRASAD